MGTVPLFRQRNFAALWGGQLVSILGERLTYLALLGLIARHTASFTEPYRSSLLLAVMLGVMLAPVLLLAPFTGAWVDRCDLKRVMVISDLLRGAIVIFMPVLYLATHAVAPVFALVFLLFTCNVFFLPAKSAITPEIVDPAQLLLANTLLSAAGIAATGAGFLAGSWVVDHWGWPVALYINAATYLVSVVSLLFITYRPHETRPATMAVSVRGYLHEVREGWGLVRGSAPVALGLLALGAVWAGGGFVHVAGNQHIQRAASIPGVERLGGLMFVLTAGSGLGTWLVNRHGHGRRPSTLLGGGLLLATVGLTALAVSSRFAVFAVAGFLIGLAAAPVFVLSETLLQLGTEPRQRGRVFSARDFLMRLLLLVGTSAAGWATPRLGTGATLVVCAAMVGVIGVVVLAWGHRDPALGATKVPAAD
ncbi:MAG: MFS transporter [Candidatus Eisenbacteria bacterium]|nr:MFS transporter [Candidatus Eisenbacteria bacterium]